MKVTLVVSFQKSVQRSTLSLSLLVWSKASFCAGSVYGLCQCWFGLWSLSVLVRSVLVRPMVSVCAGSVYGLCAGSVYALCLCWFGLWSFCAGLVYGLSVLAWSMVFLCWPGLGDRVKGLGLEVPASLSLDELCFMDVLWLSPQTALWTSCGCPPTDSSSWNWWLSHLLTSACLQKAAGGDRDPS